MLTFISEKYLCEKKLYSNFAAVNSGNKLISDYKTKAECSVL